MGPLYVRQRFHQYRHPLRAGDGLPDTVHFSIAGATAFLVFFTPTTPSASPRNTLCGHAIGIICGYAALWVTGLQHAGPAIVTELGWTRILATALSLATTGALMIRLNVPHPPAAATTLIVSLGVVSRPAYLVVLEAAVGLLVVQAIIINRLTGVRYPFWPASPRRTSERWPAEARCSGSRGSSLARLMPRDRLTRRTNRGSSSLTAFTDCQRSIVSFDRPFDNLGFLSDKFRQMLSDIIRSQVH